MKKIAEVQPHITRMLGYTKEVIEHYDKKFKALNELKNKTPEERRVLFIEKWSSWLLKYKARLSEEKKAAEQKPEENSLPAKNRKTLMNQMNPVFILRNYLLENCIDKAENGDFSEIEKLMELLQHPFVESEAKLVYCRKAPSDGTKICVSCSS
jgi:uncharacterized protein YdiU (UPF0061 family)